MNAVGIDVSSRESTVAVLRPFGEVVKLPFDVRHSAEDLAALAEQLKSIEGETRVVMEHTGRYYESVAKVLHEAGLYVSAVAEHDLDIAVAVHIHTLDQRLRHFFCQSILLWIRFDMI